MEQAICWGHWQALPSLDAKADVPTIQIVGFKTTQREIQEIYNDVYQLQRLPDPPLCVPEWVKELACKILTSLEECLWWRWGGGQEWCPTRASTSDHPAKAPQRTQQRDDDSCGQALAKAREAHWQALAAAHLLEERIERLSWSVTRAWPSNCQCFHSHSHSRRQSQGCQRRCTPTPTRREHLMVLRERQAQSPSPSPTQLKKHVTFWNQRDETSSEEDPSREFLGQATGGELEEYDLGPLHILKPELESFLETLTPTQGTGDRGDPQPEPSIKNYGVWLEWWACQVNTPHWWGELVTIPNAGDPKRLSHKIHVWHTWNSGKLQGIAWFSYISHSDLHNAYYEIHVYGISLGSSGCRVSYPSSKKSKCTLTQSCWPILSTEGLINSH